MPADIESHSNQTPKPKNACKLPKFLSSLLSIPKMFTNFCTRHAFNPIVFGVMLVLVLSVLIISIGFSIKSVTNISSKTTSFGLEDIGELVTQAGYFTNVQVINDQREVLGIGVPFTQSKCIFSYDGRVKAGMDFSSIQITVDEQQKVVHVKLPPAQILSTEVDEDSLYIYDEVQSIFTPFTLDKVKESRLKLVEDVRDTALQNGLLESASANAETIMKSLLCNTYDPEIYSYAFEHEQSQDISVPENVKDDSAL